MDLCDCGLFNMAGAGRNEFSNNLTHSVSAFQDRGHWRNGSAVVIEKDPLDSLQAHWDFTENLTAAGKTGHFRI